MARVSIVSGHIDEPDNGVYCKQCEHACFEENVYLGECKIGRMPGITRDSYCTPGGVERVNNKEA